MHRLNKFQTWLMVAVVVIILSYGMDSLRNIDVTGDQYLDKFLLVLFSFLAASLAGNFATILFRFSYIRSVIMGSKYVEGHWLILTAPSKSDKETSPLLKPGILYLSYDRSCQEIRVQTTRLGDNGNIYTTQSEVAHIRVSGPKIRYLNYFKLSGSTYESQNGFSAGEFATIHGFLQRPITFEADISTQNENVTRRQFGMKISSNVVRKYYKQFGTNWIKYLLYELREVETDKTPEEREIIIQKLCVSSQSFRKYLEDNLDKSKKIDIL